MTNEEEVAPARQVTLAKDIEALLVAAGYENDPAFVMAIWHGQDRLAVLASRVPQSHITSALQQVMDKMGLPL